MLVRELIAFINDSHGFALAAGLASGTTKGQLHVRGLEDYVLRHVILPRPFFIQKKIANRRYLYVYYVLGVKC